VELIIFSKKIDSTQIIKPPLFIIGHYRSGTTLLQKLLTSDHRFGYIKYVDVFCPIPAFLFEDTTRRLLQLLINVFKIKNIFFNNMILRLDDPGEEDLYMISGSSQYTVAWGFMFPKAIAKYYGEWTDFVNNKKKEKWERAYLYYLKRITIKNNGKQLILKNPPNTARVKYLLEMFPDAKFIFVYRNPYRVFYSMQNLWENVIEKHFSLQKISEHKRSEIIFNLYLKKMHQFEKDKELIPRGNLIEIKYEDLEKNPTKEVERIYTTLNIPSSDNTIDSIKQRLELEKKYSKFKYQYQDKTLDIVNEKWEYFINKWNYSRPETKTKKEVHI